ncbi:sortase family protein [Sphingobacterium thalpophilum]|uniref:Uncharacterized protein n=1 Tax=Sphingobacterium thalpophilum TaxID=259 RepID=A0A4U9UM56_9SPHI|nr:hypothetical protein [Sphingobacterium thalpophilum]VTR34536.1 Uncharacterised protein [Sphingobacterium thalpophilum]
MARETVKRKISLPQSELFRNIAEVDLGDTYLDLHNDYECVRLEYKVEDKECRLTFKRVNMKTESSYELVDLVFIDSVMQTCSFVFDEGVLDDFKTIDLLYRGRFENSNGLTEFDSFGRSFYYINFYSGIQLNVFAIELIVEL